VFHRVPARSGTQIRRPKHDAIVGIRGVLVCRDALMTRKSGLISVDDARGAVPLIHANAGRMLATGRGQMFASSLSWIYDGQMKVGSDASMGLLLGHRLILSAISAAIASCGGDAAQPEVADGSGDRPYDGSVHDVMDSAQDQPFNPSCHYDCFGAVTCKDGIVTVWAHAPVPCEFWTGECPHQQAGTCQRGCSTARLSSYNPFQTCPLTICKEASPKLPGDGCEADQDCRPTRAETEDEIRQRDGGLESLPGDGGVRQTYLRCDPTKKECVEAPEVVVPDWMKACDPALLAAQDPGAYGPVVDPSCAGGVCVISAIHDDKCRPQGCSRWCSGDDECPQGAVCQQVVVGVCAEGADAGQRAYCKPGSRNDLGAGLVCP
jgi:hypothetical protein